MNRLWILLDKVKMQCVKWELPRTIQSWSWDRSKMITHAANIQSEVMRETADFVRELSALASKMEVLSDRFKTQ